ncbi:MAG: hypothetical protein IH830_05065 [Planctomycetes bacterium]|nr:hypothetical protein [Planctomycetota bacterium]
MKQWLLNNWFLLVTALVAVYGAVLATLNALQRRERGEQRLAPGDHALHVHPLRYLGKSKGAAPHPVWIGVQSNMRELDRVAGTDTLRILNEHLSSE